jgi:hypothetical protein
MTKEVRLREVIKEDLPIFFEHQLNADALEMAAHAPRDKEAFDAHWTEILAK